MSAVAIDETHDPAAICWVAGAAGHRDFPVQNLPFGIFCPAGGDPGAGVAIVDCTLHLPASIGDYTDFYVGIHHATNVGRQF